MNYKKFLTKLSEQYSNEKLKEFKNASYISWKSKGITTQKQKDFIKNKYIPYLIKRNDRQDIQYIKLLQKSSIMRLAYVRCKQKKVKLTSINAVYKLITEGINILNVLDKDDKNVGIKRMLENYDKQVRAGHYDTDDTI